MGPIGLIDGKIIGLDEKVIEIEDRGYQFGDGVYEVTRVYNHRPFALNLHFERLRRSLSELRISSPYTFEELAKFHDLLIQTSGIGEGSVYLQITRGVSPRAHVFPEHVVSRLTMTIQPVTPKNELRAAGAAGIFVPDERWLRCDIKSINLLPNVLAKQQATEAGAFEAIQVRDGWVTEGSMTNFFVVKDGLLRTHPANHLILRGISRRLILERLAPQLGLRVAEEPFGVAFAKSADEAFVTATVTEVMPMVSLDGARIGNGKPGPVARRLIEALHALVAEECGVTRSQQQAASVKQQANRNS
jgi:D-alanine transaminase